MLSNTPGYGSAGNIPPHRAAQQALSPQVETLQVDEILMALTNAVEYHEETVRALMRRLHPVTGDYVSAIESPADPSWQRVPLAQSIAYQLDRVSCLTKEVQAAIHALQI